MQLRETCYIKGEESYLSP